MKWFYLWFLIFFVTVVFGGSITGKSLGSEEIGGVALLSALILFLLQVLWPNFIARLGFRISTSILTLPYIGKFAFKHGLKNFKPGSEPEGFRGIKWNTDISTLSEYMKYQYPLKDYGFVGVEIYTRTGDVLRLGRAELKEILYGFVEGKLFVVFINTKDFEIWNRLKQATFEKFGKGFQSDIGKEEYSWKGRATRVLLRYDETFGEAVLSMASKSYLKQVIKQKATAGF